MVKSARPRRQKTCPLWCVVCVSTYVAAVHSQQTAQCVHTCALHSCSHARIAFTLFDARLHGCGSVLLVNKPLLSHVT